MLGGLVLHNLHLEGLSLPYSVEMQLEKTASPVGGGGVGNATDVGESSKGGETKTLLKLRISYTLNIGWCQHSRNSTGIENQQNQSTSPSSALEKESESPEILRVGDFYNDTQLEVVADQHQIQEDVQLVMFEGL